MRIHQRATGVAGIDGSVGLNKLPGFTTVAVGIRTIQRAHDSARHGEAQSERISERQHGLPSAQFGRIAPRNAGQIGCVHFYHCKVGKRIGANQLRRQYSPVAQRDIDVHRAFDHVIVGDYVPVRRNNHTAAEAMLDPWPLRHGHRHSELPERVELLHVVVIGIIAIVVAALSASVRLRSDCDVYDRRSNARSHILHRAIKGQQWFNAAVVEGSSRGGGRRRCCC